MAPAVIIIVIVIIAPAHALVVVVLLTVSHGVLFNDSSMFGVCHPPALFQPLTGIRAGHEKFPQGPPEFGIGPLLTRANRRRSLSRWV
jgi:hypothetical protein